MSSERRFEKEYDVKGFIEMLTAGGADKEEIAARLNAYLEYILEELASDAEKVTASVVKDADKCWALGEFEAAIAVRHDGEVIRRHAAGLRETQRKHRAGHKSEES